MQAYSISVPLTLRGKHQVKHVAAANNLQAPQIEGVHVLGAHEMEQIKQRLPKEHPNAKLEDVLKVVSDQTLARWEHWPVYLGPRSGSSNTLRQQLADLRAKHPQRQHFRIGINNGFGANLGDSMLGATAFRCVAPVLQELLPQVTVDVIMGWTQGQSVASLYEHTPGIDRVVTQTPTLAELGRYQALFNTHNLIKLPRYGQMPVVDWYLWWLGMEPASVPAASKRNQIHIEPDDTAFVAQKLGPQQGPLILLNQKASVPLRSAPSAFVARLARHLLKQWPKARLVVLQDVGLEHHRILNLSADVTTIGRLAALMAQVDAVVTPDTYPLHLADATSTPCVGLFTSISASAYPYYPLMQGLHLPKAEELPAWGESKVSTEQWEKIGPQYDAAWAAWPLEQIVQALRDVMQRKRKDGQRHTLPLPAPLPRTAYRLAQPAAPEAKIHWEGAAQVHPEEVSKLLDNLWHVAKQVLVHGDHAALLGAG
ncbi:MAG: glycosyltransferase family 9 protein, partial [Macromonas sp.]